MGPPFKIEPQRNTYIFLGYLDGFKGYQLLDLDTRDVVIRSVKFEETPSHPSVISLLSST